MMEWETLKVEGAGPVRHLVLNRPRIHNAVNTRLLSEMSEACRYLDEQRDCRVVVLRGAGPSFCAGADLKENLTDDASLGEMVHRARLGQRAIAALQELVPVTIAAVHGHVIGGGACFAAACDFRIAAESARVCVRETGLGISLSWNAIPAFIHLVGPSKAKEMIMFAETYQPATLLDYGYFDQVAPGDGLLPAAEKLAAKVVAQPPLPIEMTKASINAAVAAMDRALFHLDPYGLAFSARTRDSSAARAAAFGGEPLAWQGE